MRRPKIESKVPEDYFEWNLKVLRYLGFGQFLKPKLKEPTKTKYSFFYTTGNFPREYVLWSFISILVKLWVPASELWGFIQSWGDQELMVSSLMFGLYQWIMLSKFFWFYAKGKQMRLLAYLLEVETKRYYQNYQFIRERVRLTRHVLMGGYTLVVMTVLSACVVSFYTSYMTHSSLDYKLTELPFLMPMPFPLKSPWLWTLGFLLQVIPMTLFGMMFFAADLFIFSCMMHAAGQFQILQEALITIDQRVMESILSHKPILKSSGRMSLDEYLDTGAINLGTYQTALEAELLQSVKHHQLLLAICDLLEDTYSAGFFTHFLNGISAVVLGIIAMNMKESLDLGKLLVFLYLATVLLELFTLCWAGNEVTHQSLAVGPAVLKSRWYYSTPSWKRMGVLLTLRAQRPVHLTAGKFVILSLASFINTLKAAYSYNTVLSHRS